MAASSNSIPRDLIIKDGYLKHREPGIVNRWRHRYVVFRTSTAGKFIFTVYRDKPAIPSNEQVDIALEDYGGLDTTLKLEGEKYVFSIITVRSTECFAVDGQDQLDEWNSVLQEYLGLELVMNIEVPYKQKSLKAGRAQMRIRNTGFTITSMDSPPKCLGAWQILHIRKFGGTESFRFETGSKCPSGEYLYVIKADQLKKMKEVFTNLSHHKPIFENDRTGRRMTREHKILQQFRDKQQVGPRLSLQHTTPPMTANKHLFRKVESGFDLARPRSNAVMIEDTPLSSTSSNVSAMKNSPSANDIHGYYNLPQGGGASRGEEFKKKTNSLSTSTLNKDNVYYNRDAIELQLQKKRKDDSSDSDSDSDNDFVDINHLKENGSGYYNLRDNPILSKARISEQPTYENYQPKYQPESTQPTPSNKLYNNYEAIMQQAEAVRNSNGSLNSVPMNNTENVTIKEPSPTSQEAPNSDTDSLDDTSFRNRTTSIVEHIMISADQSTRSCEDLLSSDQKVWNKEKTGSTTVDGNHSDSELINGPSSNRKKKLNKSGRLADSDTNDDCDYDQPSPRTSANMKSPNRLNEYDHLEISEQKKGSSSEVSSEGVVPYMKYEDVHGHEKVVPLHRPRLPDRSTITKSFHNRKHKSHIYEAVEVPDDTERGYSPSSSPDSSAQTTPTHPSKQDVYKRKTSLLGHEHNYEFVSKQKSPSPPPPGPPSSSEAGPSFIKKTFAGITSPTRLTSLRKNKQPASPAPQGKAPHVPPPSSGVDTSHITNQSTSSPASGRAIIKKPVPVPRTIMQPPLPHPSTSTDSMYVNGTVIKKQITALENQPPSSGNQHSGTHREGVYVNGSVIKEQINALENRESTYVNGTVIKDQINALEKAAGAAPQLPPKPRQLISQNSEQNMSYRSPLLQQAPDRFCSSENQGNVTMSNKYYHGRTRNESSQHYADVYVYTEPVCVPKDKSKLSLSVAEKRHPPTEYTQIDHFRTEKFHDLIQQRKQEKNLATTNSATALV